MMFYPTGTHLLCCTSYMQPVYHPITYYPASPYMLSARPQYPEVDPTLFHQSAGAFKTLMNDATIILNKLADSKEFAYQVMNAAQVNDKDEVEKLIKSTGVKENVNVDFNPDAITLEMMSKLEKTECCKLAMTLRWR
ncbi:hypothetical protein ACW2QC_14110 [Virgibacillus sp. FSP13]